MFIKVLVNKTIRGTAKVPLMGASAIANILKALMLCVAGRRDATALRSSGIAASGTIRPPKSTDGR